MVPERRYERQLPWWLTPRGRSGEYGELRSTQPVPRVDNRLSRRETGQHQGWRRHVARSLLDPAWHKHGELESTPAIRCDPHHDRRHEQQAEDGTLPHL